MNLLKGVTGKKKANPSAKKTKETEERKEPTTLPEYEKYLAAAHIIARAPLPVKDKTKYTPQEIVASIVQLAPYFDRISDLLFLTKNTGIITDVLNDFRELDDYVTPNILEYIGEDSMNGFINKLSLSKTIGIYKFDFNTILKSTKFNPDAHSDNLGYEYFVGAQCINTFARMYPMFIKTYGFFMYKDKAAYDLFIDEKEGTNINKYSEYIEWVDSNTIKSLTKYVEVVSTRGYTMLAIESEYIPTHTSLNSFITQKILNVGTEIGFVESWLKLVGILYMVYMPLSNLAKSFTHYDLHPGNVLLYQKKAVARHGIPNDIFRVTVKSLEGKPDCTFITDTLPVIIDYGRSWISCKGMVAGPDSSRSSAEYAERLCSLEPIATSPSCGYDFGHRDILRDPENKVHQRENIWNISNKKNESMDTILLFYATQKLIGIELPRSNNIGRAPIDKAKDRKKYMEFWNRINLIGKELYVLWIKLIDDFYYYDNDGTPEYYDPNKITTVSQVCSRLEAIINHPLYQQFINDLYNDADQANNTSPTFELIMFKDGYEPFQCNPLR